jgi:hypothetical protein
MFMELLKNFLDVLSKMSIHGRGKKMLLTLKYFLFKKIRW